MNVFEGDIVFTTCPGIPLCHHVGIVVFEAGQPMVYHNSPSRKNRFGGNVLADRWETFMAGRELLRVERSCECSDYVREYSYANRHRSWNALHYNCEDFVNAIKTGEEKSRLRLIWQAAVLAVCFA